MDITKRIFGQTSQGQDIYLYSLSNSKGMRADVINYGATLVKLLVPDQKGIAADVVTGYDRLEDYEKNRCYFGVTVGPNANRIAEASFTLEGVSYSLEKNDGKNNLHSHSQLGYQMRIWDVQEKENAVAFSLEDQDGCMGFPGNKRLTVTYSITEANELKIEYDGISDRNTILNPTNHTYFNLSGHQNESIYNHELTIHAGSYTPVAAGAIPTGEIRPVAGTPMDFTVSKPVGREIESEYEQLQFTDGYDHNWVIDQWDGTVREIARLYDPVSGRCMIVSSDLPGLQFYAGNSIVPHEGKEGVVYQKRCALCLETQYYPDTANRPAFPASVFGPETPYHSATIFRFEA